MSSICHGFVQNAWRKDICSNCFRLRDDHDRQQSVISEIIDDVDCASSLNAVSILVSSAGQLDPKSSLPSLTTRYQSPSNGFRPTFSSSKFGGSVSKLSSPKSTVLSSSAVPSPPREERQEGANCSSSASAEASPAPSYQNTFSSGRSTTSSSSSSSSPVRVTLSTASSTGAVAASGGVKPTIISLNPKTVQNGLAKSVESAVVIVENGTTSSVLTTSPAAIMNSEPSKLNSAGGGLAKNARMVTTTSSIAVTSKRSCRGILKAMDGRNGRKLSVKFRSEVCEVIGYGGPDSDSEPEADTPEDPQDDMGLSELLARNSTTNDEKVLHQQTIKNTNFNSIKTNLMGYAPIEIGPIVGCTGGKSLQNSAKPLVSIGTFEARKEPLRIRKIISKDDDALNTSDSDEDPRPATRTRPPMKKQTSISGANLKTSTTAAEAPKKPAVYSQFSATTTTSSSPPAANKNPVENTPKPETIRMFSASKAKEVALEVKKEELKSVESSKPLKPVLSKPSVPAKTVQRFTPKEAPKPVVAFASDQDFKKPEPTSPARTSEKNEFSKAIEGSKAPKPILKNPMAYGGGDATSNLNQKRSTFLKDIISEPKEQVTVLNHVNHLHTYNRLRSTEEPMSMLPDSLELPAKAKEEEPTPPPQVPARLVTSDNFKKLDVKLSTCKGYEIEDNPSEFDDSLEDSGLEVGIHRQISSNNKTTRILENSSESENDTELIDKGSTSDSGNEHDYNDKRENLFISVDQKSEDGLDSVTKPKLSPDSVLFSSSSEASNTGSTESISECVNIQVVTNIIKRTAPLPPPVVPVVPAIPAVAEVSPAVAAYSPPEEPVSDLYDDIGLYRNNRYSNDLEYNDDPNEDYQEEPDSLYDDCTTVKAEASKKSTGSYDFTAAKSAGLTDDASGGGDGFVDTIPTRPSDGIEFFGIRKIDSETHLNEPAFNMSRPRRSSSPEVSSGKKERSSSTSPKPRRKAVNQFFSTIGKKAGAAFAAGSSPLSGATMNFMRQKSPSPAPVTSTVSPNYRRSLSQDELGMTRAQEIYATFTPASLKFKGLSPVLQKLSKMGDSTQTEDDPSAKSKKSKMFSLKKLWKSTKEMEVPNDSQDQISTTSKASKYEFKTEKQSVLRRDTSPALFSQSITNLSSSASASARLDGVVASKKPMAPGHKLSPPSVAPPKAPNMHPSGSQTVADRRHHHINPMARPPPPPPRVHSLDLLNKASSTSTASIHATVNKPARPPPPVRSNRIAPSVPSFTAVFASGQDQDPDVPPCKPRRKASMNNGSSGTSSSSGASKSPLEPIADLSLETNVSSLNFETMRLIAGQESAKIRHTNLQQMTGSIFGDFAITDKDPMASGNGYAFYTSTFNGHPCVLFLQEECVYRISHTCTEVLEHFTDVVPAKYLPWSCGQDEQVYISVLPPCTVSTIINYIGSSAPTLPQKHFVLLSSLSYWGRQDMSDLLVFNGADDRQLVYVVPAYTAPSDPRRQLHSSRSQASNDFEVSLKQLLLQPQILSASEQQTLFNFLSGSSAQVHAQLKLFLQIKLFSSKLRPEDLSKLRVTQSERVLIQWLEKERALCMKEAIERTLTNRQDPISPLKKAYVEFLTVPDSSAKHLLDLILEIC